jgi:hypothetical protein
MRVSPAIRVKGRIARQASGPQILTTAFRDNRNRENHKSGPAACLHVRYVDVDKSMSVRDLSRFLDFEDTKFQDSNSKTWSGLSSNDGSVLVSSDQL